MTAKGLECQCSCLGKNHGSGSSKPWFIISETVALKWGDKDYSCRLVTEHPDATAAKEAFKRKARETAAQLKAEERRV